MSRLKGIDNVYKQLTHLNQKHYSFRIVLDSELFKYYCSACLLSGLGTSETKLKQIWWLVYPEE